MAVDRSAFVVISFQAPMAVMWRALRAARNSLGVARIYWHPDDDIRDGHHFRFEIPVAGLSDPLGAEMSIQEILRDHGAMLR